MRSYLKPSVSHFKMGRFVERQRAAAPIGNVQTDHLRRVSLRPARVGEGQTGIAPNRDVGELG